MILFQTADLRAVLETTATVFAIVSAIGAGGYAFSQALRANYWTSIANEWKEVSAARLEKLSDLGKRFTEQEEKLLDLEKENNKLTRLNLNLQDQVNSLRADIHELEGRLDRSNLRHDANDKQRSN